MYGLNESRQLKSCSVYSLDIDAYENVNKKMFFL